MGHGCVVTIRLEYFEQNRGKLNYILLLKILKFEHVIQNYVEPTKELRKGDIMGSL